jgi:hypothetical protein
MKVEITNMDEFQEQLNQLVLKAMKIASIMIEQEILNQLNKMKLQGSGDLRQRGYNFTAIQEGNKTSVVVETGVPYAVYLEYGTYEYWRRFGLDNFPQTPDPKKKNMSRTESKNYPRGMQPFAVIRRVLWNKEKMNKIFEKAFKQAQL